MMEQIYKQGSDYAMLSPDHGCFGYVIVFCKDKEKKRFQFIKGFAESELKAQSKAIALINKREDKKLKRRK